MLQTARKLNNEGVLIKMLCIQRENSVRKKQSLQKYHNTMLHCNDAGNPYLYGITKQAEREA